MPEPRVKQAPPRGGAPSSGRPLKATNPQKVALDAARSLLRDHHMQVAEELIAQLSATKTVALGGGESMEVPDYATRQGAIDRITARSGFVPDPADVPTSLGVVVLDILTRPVGL